MKQLTIVIITNNYKPYSAGVVSSIIALAEGLKTEGHKVYIITLQFLDNHEQEECVIRLNCPIKFKYHGNYMAIPWRPCYNLCKILKIIKPDIIHSQHPFYLGTFALKVARCHKIPIVFTYHAQYEKYVHYVPFPQVLSAMVIKKMALSYCKQVDAIIAPSQSMFNFLKSENINKKVIIAPSSINPIFFADQASTSLVTLSEQCETKVESNGKFKLITVSRFVKEKNIPFLLKMFSKLDLNKFEFFLVGFGVEQANLEKLARNLGIINSITFVVSPEKSKIVELYKQADLFIFASNTETQGLVLAEAMACGTPAVALEAPGAVDIIKHGVN